MVTLTVRGISPETQAALAEAAREGGQSLQAYLLATLNREASFRRNSQNIAEAREQLSAGGGADESAPDAAEVLRQERARRLST